jgi:hypothetical protein
MVVGVFRFTSMNHGANHATGCIASAVDNTPCPENIGAMAVHHIQAFISFFSVIPPIPFIFILVILFSVSLNAGHFFIKPHGSLLADLLFGRVRPDPERQLRRPREITRWLSLFENSPSLHEISFIISNLKNLCKQKITNTIKFMTPLIQTWHSILSAEWSLMQTVLRQALITKAKHTTFALYTARIISQPIL